jgi:PAS domain S-box-containing protein
MVFIAYFIAGKIGQATENIRSSNLGPVWPAYGVALAAFLLYGPRVWPAIAASAFVVAFFSPVPHLAAAGQAAASTLAALTGRWALIHLGQFDTRLSRLRDALGLIVLGAAGSAMVSATLGLAVLYAAGVHAYSGLGPSWVIYWLGDSTGVLLITPLILSIRSASPIRSQSRLLEGAALALLLTAACFIIFDDLTLIPLKPHVLAFGVLPFIMWAAVRFGVKGVAWSTLLVATIATIETALGSGPFAQNTAFTNAVLLDVFFVVLSVTGLTLATVITERETAERERERLAREQAALEARRESEEQLRLILDSTAEGILGIDLEGRCTFCNPASLRILGYERVEDLLGKNLHQVIHHSRPDGSQHPQHECRILEVLRTGRGVHLEDEPLWRHDGTSFPAECWSYPQLRGGKVVGAVAAFVDLTLRRHAETQAAALQQELAHLGRVAMLDVLSGSLAHEINQPLTAVMANAEAALRLMETPSQPELRETLTEIVSDTRHASAVVQRMRTLLKKDAAHYELIEVNSIVSEVVKLIRGNALTRGVTVEVELGSDIGHVLGDRVQIQQVVLNLLVNALDAVQGQEKSQRRVSLKTAARNGAAVVEVCDRGAGLSDDELTQIFEPFYSTKSDGIGLGLSISRAIVGAHGGKLDVLRNADQGVTFSATFPFWEGRHVSQRKAGPASLKERQ